MSLSKGSEGQGNMVNLTSRTGEQRKNIFRNKRILLELRITRTNFVKEKTNKVEIKDIAGTSPVVLSLHPGHYLKGMLSHEFTKGWFSLATES